MIWLMEILNIYPEEQLLIKYCAKKHLILLEIQNMMDIKEAIKNFLIKKFLVEQLKMKSFQIKN